MKTIPLTHNRIAIVDDDDYDRLLPHSWSAVRGRGDVWYARTSSGLPMHHLVLDYYGRVDHVNGDGLDNRKTNLRKATRSQNAANAKKRRGKRSRYKGVCANGRGWCARIFVDGERVYLGQFSTEEEAAHAYDAGAKKLFGEFARPNFP